MPREYVRRPDEEFSVDPNAIPSDNTETEAGFIGRLANRIGVILGPGLNWFSSPPATLTETRAHIDAGSSAHGGVLEKVQQGGTDKPKQRTLNFTGGGVSLTDDSSGGGRTLINIPASGPSSLTIQDEGSGDVVGYVKLNFQGPTVSVSDDGSNARANITVDPAPGEGTVTPSKADASAIIPFICTSTTRPSTAKTLFVIFESDTQNLLYNSGTLSTPVWSAISWQRVGVNGGTSIAVRNALNVVSDALSVVDNPSSNRTDLILLPSPTKLTESDFMGDWVVTGLLPSAGTITQVPTGTAYVGGARIVVASPLSVTLAPSSDNYVDIDALGNLYVTSPTIGSAEPSIVSGRVRLFAGTTNSSSVVATVIDKRVLKPVVKAHDHATADLPASGVTAGTYDSPRITVNSKGQVTSAINGAAVVVDPATAVTLGTSLLSVAAPSGTEATPYVVGRNDPIFETRIEGLAARWDATNGISVLPGAAWIQSLNRVYNVPSTISLSGLSLTASTWYYLYLYDNGGTPAIEFVPTAPAVAYKGDARSKTSDPSRRFLFAGKTNASGALYNFYYRADGWVQYLESTSAAPFLVSNAASTSVTNIDCTAVVPSHSRAAKLLVVNLASNDGRIGHGDRLYTLTTTAYNHYVVSGSANTVDIELSSTQRYGIIVSSSSTTSMSQYITAFHNPR